MTRKHYLAIANEIARIRKEETAVEPEIIVRVRWHLFSARLAEFFEQDNPGFDRKRFITACMEGE